MAKSPITARIDAKIAEKGISKAKFYEDCGITSASYSQWNTGKTAPKMKNLVKIAEYLDTTTEYLFAGHENENKPTTDNDDELTEKQRAAFDLISNMSDEDIDAFIRIASAMVNRG